MYPRWSAHFIALRRQLEFNLGCTSAPSGPTIPLELKRRDLKPTPAQFMNEQNQPIRQQLGGIILAGGKSSRMGVDKAALRLQGSTFVQQLTSHFQLAGLPVVIVEGFQAALKNDEANNGADSIFFARDRRPDAGPLEGIRVGLEKLAAFAEFGFVISCDSPLLKIEVVEYLMSRIGSSEAIAPRSGSEIFGTTAIYRTDLHARFDHELAQGNHSVKYVLNHLNVVYVDAEELRVVDPQLVSLININTPEEYERVLGELAN